MRARLRNRGKGTTRSSVVQVCRGGWADCRQHLSRRRKTRFKKQTWQTSPGSSMAGSSLAPAACSASTTALFPPMAAVYSGERPSFGKAERRGRVGQISWRCAGACVRVCVCAFDRNLMNLRRIVIEVSQIDTTILHFSLYQILGNVSAASTSVLT